jgi:tripartite-type tricarboxylate transporter receptor subunit TctC
MWRWCIVAAVAIAAAAFDFTAESARLHAQAYPSRPIRWLVGFPAGGGSDALVRVVAHEMSADLGAPVVVENKTGASGNIAAAALAQADPDGYTLLLGDRSSIIINADLFKDPGFDPKKDFVAVGLIARVPMVLVVGPSVKATTLRDFIAQAKAKPGEFSYASPGAGTQQELTFEILKASAHIDVMQVRYRGGNQQIMDLVQGVVSSTVAAYPAVQSFLASGSLRALAIARASRRPEIPDVPTFAELGVPELDSAGWVGLFTRAGTPPEIVERLGAALSRAVTTPDSQSKIAATGWEPQFGTKSDMEWIIKADMQVWPALVKSKGNVFQ